jgi:hypothetical protein
MDLCFGEFHTYRKLDFCYLTVWFILLLQVLRLLRYSSTVFLIFLFSLMMRCAQVALFDMTGDRIQNYVKNPDTKNACSIDACR